MNCYRITGAAIAMVAGLGTVDTAKAEMSPSLSFSGVPGLIDMPSGDALSDGALAVGVSNLGDQTR